MRCGLPVPDLDAFLSQWENEVPVSLLALSRGAEKIGFDAPGVRLTWEDLVQLDHPVILFVSEHHFVCLDPQEKKIENGEPSVILYDWPEITRYVGQKELSKTWKGESLLLIPRENAQNAQEQGPALQFDCRLVDFGKKATDRPLVLQFPFRNVGTEGLQISEIKKSCTCTSVETNLSVLEPGESGILSMTLDLTVQNGFVTSVASLVTNDPRGEVAIVARGFTERLVLLSRREIDFGRLLPGQQVKRELALTDRTGRSFELTEAQVLWKERQTIGSQIEISWERILEGNQGDTSLRSPYTETVVPRFQIVVTATAKSNPGSPGKSQGEIVLKTTDTERTEILIPFQIEILDDEYFTPEVLFFGSLEPGGTSTKRLTLCSRLGKDVSVKECLSKEASKDATGEKLEVHPISKDTVELALTVPDDALSGAILKGNLRVTSSSGKNHDVAWLCTVRSRRREDSSQNPSFYGQLDPSQPMEAENLK